MIAPAAKNLQIARGESFSPESRLPGQGDGGHITPLDIGLKPVEFQGFKSVAEDQLHGIGHVALTCERRANVIANKGALKIAPNNVAQIDRAQERLVCLATD